MQPACVSSSSSGPIQALADSFQGLSIGAPTCQKRLTQVHLDDVHVLQKHPDGSCISGSKDTTVRIWNTALQYTHTIQPAKTQTYRHWITALAVFSDKSWAIGSRKGQLSLFSPTHTLVSQTEVYNPGDHICKQKNHERINCIAELIESPGHFVVGLPTQLQTWRLHDARRLNRTKVSDNDWLYCVDPLQNRRYALVIGSDVEVWQNVQADGRWTFQKVSELYALKKLWRC
jgi:WD40 repeat protein